MAPTRTSADSLQAGWSALGKGNWAGARSCFEAALAAEETPEALEGLGWAGYCLDDEGLTFDSREQAFRLYRERGDDRSAARIAAWLASASLEFRGEPAVANGWLQRAHRLLDGLEPRAGSRLARRTRGGHHPGLAGGHGDRPQAGRRGRRARPDVRRPRARDGWAGSRGAIAGQRRRESQRACGGSMRRPRPRSPGRRSSCSASAWACLLPDLGLRASAGLRPSRTVVRALSASSANDHGIGNLLGVCKAHYAGVLTWQGRWGEAESELLSAAESFAASRPPMVGDALVRLAELRRRQGRLDEAEELFGRCEGHFLALRRPGICSLSTAVETEGGDGASPTATFAASRTRTGWSGALGSEVALRAYIARGDTTNVPARAWRSCGRSPSRPGRRHCGQRCWAAEGSARGEAEADLDDRAPLPPRTHSTSSPASQAPFENARVRLDFASTLIGLGRRQAARREIQAALAAFRRDRARKARGRSRRGDAGASPRCRSRRSCLKAFAKDTLSSAVSRREFDVLALVAQGLTNQEIAKRLVLQRAHRPPPHDEHPPQARPPIARGRGFPRRPTGVRIARSGQFPHPATIGRFRRSLGMCRRIRWAEMSPKRTGEARIPEPRGADGFFSRLVQLAALSAELRRRTTLTGAETREVEKQTTDNAGNRRDEARMR